MRRKRFRILPLIIFILVAVAMFFGISYTVKTIKYHKTYEYKLLKVGYNIDQVHILDNLTSDTKDYILELEYDSNIPSLASEKYFLEKNLKKYLSYLSENDKSFTDIVAIVNVGANNDWYTNTRKTDLSKGNLILVNKFNMLDSSYNSDDMVKVSVMYSYGTNQMLTEDTFDAFLNMWTAAKKEGLTLIINSSYRSFEDQLETYDYYKSIMGSKEADLKAAHAGFSEHQTGMAVDIQTYGSSGKTFEDFDEFKWLEKNAYKYGFILRYPKDKEYLTGYAYESWHFRYVGVEVATYIYENNITFDEYYAYFLEGDNT